MAKYRERHKELSKRKEKLVNKDHWALNEAKTKIRAHFRQMTASFLDSLNELSAARRRCKLSDDEWSSLFEQCGFRENEIPLLMNFEEALGHKREELHSHGVGLDTVIALLRCDGPTRTEALRRIEAGALLGPEDISRIEARYNEIWPKPHSLRVVRRQGLHNAGLRLAARSLHAMSVGADKLVRAMRQHQMLHNFYVNDADQKAIVEAAIERLRAFIVRTASEMLVDFDQGFPGADLPIDDWFNPEKPITLNEFSQCRYSLQVLASGRFEKSFPQLSSDWHHWSVENSISFLAGGVSSRSGATTAKGSYSTRLTAIDINAGLGGAALGMHDANYNVAALYSGTPLERASLADNLVGWNVRQQDLLDVDNSADVGWCLTKRSGQRIPLHLLAGKLASSPWVQRGKGSAQDHVLQGAMRLLAEYAPEGFFLEAPADLDDPRNRGDVSRILLELSKLGYEVQQTPVSATMVGLPQDRIRTLIIGVRKSHGAALCRPLLRTPIQPSLGDLISDLAFPYLSEYAPIISDIPYPDDFPEAGVVYDAWAQEWLAVYGNITVPDTSTLTKPYQEDKEAWRNVGFDIESRKPLTPDQVARQGIEAPRVVMTVPILKRLQGLPDDWEVATDPGAVKVQRHSALKQGDAPPPRETAKAFSLLADTMPPELGRLAAQVVRSAITGELIDLDQEARRPFSTTGRRADTMKIGPSMFPGRGASFSFNRERLAFQDWRRQRQEETEA
jgi:site-specific DNA-cytosine methylase